MRLYFILVIIPLTGCAAKSVYREPQPVTFASFNVSMEAGNYVKETDQETMAKGPQVLMTHLAAGEHPQIRNIAEIIQRTRPDIILLNEFDFIDNPRHGIQAFINNYLQRAQHGSTPITYPYVFYAPSNTGLPSTFDLDNNGRRERFGDDALGYGRYVGQYAMVLLSKYPIVNQDIRTFQRFLWSDMPGALEPVNPANGKRFYTQQEWENLRLSSKSHWDIPVAIGDKTVHVLASHPTPPVFDGAEDRNGKRNHDELRFWLDYITPGNGGYIYDDRGVKGGLSEGASFVIMGDLNASPDRPNDAPLIIADLLASTRTNTAFIPQSEAGQRNTPDNPYAKYHTASWAARADYVIPSIDLTVADGGIFWPTREDSLYRLIEERAVSSDHRLVWLTLEF